MAWNYYRRVAESIGIDEETGKERNFSVAWFYRNNNPEDLNALARSFLGDEEALGELSFISDEEVEADVPRLVTYCTERINLSQLRSIARAIRDDISVIQGPPGTGKTQTICNILRCLMGRNQAHRPSVAVVSTNNEAIRNVIDLVENDELLQDLYAVLGKEQNRLNFYNDHRDEEWSSDFSKENGYRFSADLLQDYPIVFSTIHSLRKCFVEDEDFDGVFDYVIVDECSQVGSMLGLLAMASAKRLVLLGDDEQLPPIFKDTDDEENHEQNLPLFYLEQDDNSFMKAVSARFDGLITRSFLTDHYRSHPAIIGFCNKYVYDGQLNICTEDDGKLPIRIRWYEGDYWEDSNEFGEKVNSNLRQIKIFMEEEYPAIFERIRNDENFSVCVLSPYRYPLFQLKNEIIAYNERNEDHVPEPEIEGEGAEATEKIHQLTIHKAQGKGYDMVIFLTIKDCGSNIWAQRKDLVNVAVSRAKNEFVMITSSIWMPPEMQREYLGYSVLSGADYKELFVRHMIEHVQEQSLNRDADGYGFQRSDVRSVFDRTPYYRSRMRYRDADEENAVQKPSAPELCMLNALCDNEFIRCNYDIYREVPLSAIGAINSDNEAIRSYVERGARFDIVLVQNKKVCAIVEVDGSYHRTDEEQGNNDALKNAAVATLGEEFAEGGRFFRFPTDGTSTDEVMKVVRSLCEEAENLPVIVTDSLEKYDHLGGRMREELVRKLHDTISTAIRSLIEDLESGDEDRINHVRELTRFSYQQDQAPGEENYVDPVFCNLYLARYGYAYAFEYYVILDAVIRSYDWSEIAQNGRPTLGVSSLGCGSMIDSWSLAYALSCIREEGELDLPDGLGLSYHGEDLTEWGILFEPDDAEKQALNMYFDKHFNISAAEYINNGQFYPLLNVHIFAKFLGEVSAEIVEQIENAVRQAVRAGSFGKRNEYYICFSHSKSTVDSNNSDDERRLSTIASRIVSAINDGNNFEVSSDILEQSKFWDKRDDSGNVIGIVKSSNDNEGFPIYKFNDPYNWEGDPERSYGCKISELNDDFMADEDLEQELIAALNDFPDNGFRNPISRSHHFRFQVVKLTRRQEEQGN